LIRFNKGKWGDKMTRSKFNPKPTKGNISKKFEKENPDADTLTEGMEQEKRGRKIISKIETNEFVEIMTKDGRRQRIGKKK
jgi:hypothetical protein